ncbi:helix-turn-helix transcriptional regulator [Streptomyces sp. NBC_01210]|uniref:helix-turn-helix domain-containing protein n=1 Tax=Streptomyces sp. NBC_01210 TaxID=2903774 RepID=UPI002E12B42A|nr:helix-turn-helix transcriptional regulator [Streptomyces sp. NBC_01210]
MELTNEDDDRPTPRTVLGRRLRRQREKAELSQRALADRVGYPHTYISRVERGEQLPSLALADDLDTFFTSDFTSDGLFTDLLAVAQDSSIADYSRTVVSREAKAGRIQVFSSSLVPGLLQTEEYAYALIRESLPGESEEVVDERVAARMRRKSVFDKEEKPFYWAILDEAALKRPIGGVKCMSHQIHHLLEAVRNPHLSIQVLPFAQGEHPMLGGTLILLTLGTGATIGYVESFATGEQVESPRRVLELTQRFDVARSKALPKSESLDLMHSHLKEYENDDDS